MRLCPCTCTIAHTYAVVQLCSRAFVLLCMHHCTIAYPCAVMPLCACACTIAHNYAFVLSCLHYLVQLYDYALVRLYVRATMRLCKDWQGRQGSEEIPCLTCLYGGYAQQNLTHLLSLSHLSRASRSRETSSSWLMPKFVQMQSMSSPSSRCQVATCSTTRSKSSLST